MTDDTLLVNQACLVFPGVTAKGAIANRVARRLRVTPAARI